MLKKQNSEFSFTEIENNLKNKPFYTLFFTLVILSLFFIQALRLYMPGVYVAMFHVVFYEDIIENFLILITLIFFTLPGLTNTISKKVGNKRLQMFSIYTIAISRLIIAFHLPNIWQTIFAGILIAFYGMFISTFLTLWVKDEKIEISISNKMIFVVFSILCAFLLDYLIRTIGFSQDISLLPPGVVAEFWYITQYIWLFIQIPLTVCCIYFTRLYFPRFVSLSNLEEHGEIDTKSTGYSLIFAGIGVIWFLLFNVFLYPNIIAIYTGTNYYFNNFLSIIALIVAILIMVCVKKKYIFNIQVLAILNVLLIVFLSFFLFIGRIITYLAVIMIAISLVIIYLDFFLLFVQMATVKFKWEKVKTISNAFTIGLIFYILFSVLHIFTTDWAYVISAFKGFGPFIVLLACSLLVISILISTQINQKR